MNRLGTGLSTCPGRVERCRGATGFGSIIAQRVDAGARAQLPETSSANAPTRDLPRDKQPEGAETFRSVRSIALIYSYEQRFCRPRRACRQ